MTRRCTTPVGIAPDMLTVVEAARVVRIGRSAAYQLAREYVNTDGASGLPAMRIGGQLRVPRHLLEEYIGGPITWPIPDAPVDETPLAEPVTSATRVDPIPINRRRASRRNGAQLAFGLDA
jgi:excisionase family DNA binding protein